MGEASAALEPPETDGVAAMTDVAAKASINPPYTFRFITGYLCRDAGGFQVAFWVCKEACATGHSIDPNDFRIPHWYTHV